MQTLGSSERYEVALEILRRYNARPENIPRRMITGTRHCRGGVKKLISLPGLLIAVAFL
jgi:hypothetical protein